MKYFDAHCHVQFDAYEEDQRAVFDAMRTQEVGGVVVGVDEASSREAATLADENEHLWASVGLHPNYVEHEAYDEHAYRNLLSIPGVVAVGECGLDYFRPDDTSDAAKRRQKDVFEQQIELAAATNRPLIIHARPSRGSMDAYQDALDMLEAAKRAHGERLRGDFHFFVGDTDIARRAFAIDFTVSYTAVITFARDYDEVIRFSPLDRLLTETDAPYVAPASRRGQRNDPLSVIDVARALAEIRGEEVETVRQAVLANALRLFRLPEGATK